MRRPRSWFRYHCRVSANEPTITPSPAAAVRAVRGDDPVMRQVADLCYETLHRPFGVTRNDAWNEGDPRSTHFVVTEGDRLVGYARLIDEGRWYHVRQVVVDPRHRRQGIGAAVVRAALEEARRRGAAGVYLNARPTAVGLYERSGFRVAGEVFRMGRTWLPHVRMEQRLR
jgi:predicted GNAT family N-acyltransferase